MSSSSLSLLDLFTTGLFLPMPKFDLGLKRRERCYSESAEEAGITAIVEEKPHEPASQAIDRFRRAEGLLSLGLAVLAPSALIADENDRTRSTTRYNAALNNVRSTLGRVQACTASSAGRDNCARELDRLESAGDDYKDAVSDFRSDRADY